MFFYEQVCVRNRTLKEIAANCDSRIQRMRSWQTQNHNNLVNGAYLQPFIFETVQPLIWLNAFIRLLTHRLTTEALLWIPAPHAGRWSFQIRL